MDYSSRDESGQGDKDERKENEEKKRNKQGESCMTGGESCDETELLTDPEDEGKL